MCKNLMSLLVVFILFFMSSMAEANERVIYPVGSPHFAYRDYGDWVSGLGYHTGDDYGSNYCDADSLICNENILAAAPGIIFKKTINGKGCRDCADETTGEGCGECSETKTGCEDHGLGNSLIIEHVLSDGNKIYTLYGHLKSFASGIAEGVSVELGQVIGVMGATAYGCSPNGEVQVAHSHFEVKDQGVLENPEGTGKHYGYLGTDASGKPKDYGYQNPRDYIDGFKVDNAQVPDGDDWSHLYWPFIASDYNNRNGWKIISSQSNDNIGADAYADDWQKADSASTCGEDFHSPLDGLVIFAGQGGQLDYGNQVVIVSERQSYYFAFRVAHLENVSVYAGQEVIAGTKLGEIGKTGIATECHAHTVLYQDLYMDYVEDLPPGDPYVSAFNRLSYGYDIGSSNYHKQNFAGAFDFNTRDWPNNTPTTATEIILNKPSYEYISPKDDEDWYKIYIPPGTGKISIDLTSLPADYDLYAVDDKNNEAVKYSVQSGTVSEHIEYSQFTSSYYYIMVDGYEDANDAGVPYKLSVTTCQACFGSCLGASVDYCGPTGGIPDAPTGISASDGDYTDRVHISWNSVLGADSYTIYRGTSSSGQDTTLTSHYTTTEYNDTSAEIGRYYYYWVTASNNSGTSNLSKYDAGHRYDSISPTVMITSPTSGSSYEAHSPSLTLAGTASDNVEINGVTWSNNRGGQDAAQGTTSWTTSNISLQSGTNVITVTARDTETNFATDTITVTYNPTSCTPPGSGDWTISSSCEMSGAQIAPANVIVKPNVVLTIADGASLKIDQKNYSLRVEKDGGVLIRKDGKIY